MTKYLGERLRRFCGFGICVLIVTIVGSSPAHSFPAITQFGGGSDSTAALDSANQNGKATETVTPASNDSSTQLTTKVDKEHSSVLLDPWFVAAAVALYLLLTHIAACLKAGPACGFQRRNSCHDCCFFVDRHCRVSLPWSIPFKAFSRAPDIAGRICPFCFRNLTTDLESARGQFSGKYLKNQGIILAGALAAALATYVASVLKAR